MKAAFVIFRQTLGQYFRSGAAVIALGAFSLMCSLFLWFFSGAFNIIDWGYADMSRFFNLAPWLLIIIFPLFTMQLIQGERQAGTISLLLTAPVSRNSIIFGKFAAAKLMLLFAIALSLPALFSVYYLALPAGNMDIASLVGSYIGLLLFAMSLLSLGVFASCIAQSQASAFLIAVILAFLFYYGFYALGEALGGTTGYFIASLSMQKHFALFSRGLIDSRDIVYFIVFSLFFLLVSAELIKPHDKQHEPLGKKLRSYGMIFTASALTLLLSFLFHFRTDLTEDKRYTLSRSSQDIVEQIDEAVHFQVYLGEKLPPAFELLKNELRMKLEDYASLNKKITFNFSDPAQGKNSAEAQEIYNELAQRGVLPVELKMKIKGENISRKILPWAELVAGGESIPFPLLMQQAGKTDQEQITASIENLEFALSDALDKTLEQNRRLIAFSAGHGELKEAYMDGALMGLGRDYDIELFDFSQTANVSADSVLTSLSSIDLLIVAKPTEAFSERDKFIIDQYIMQGGATAWFIDQVSAETDSMQQNGQTLAYNRELNLTDMFFSYGVRLGMNLVQDLHCAPLKLSVGEAGGAGRYENFPWLYYPIAKTSESNPVTRNINGLWCRYASAIDTLRADGVKKEVALSTYGVSRILGTPRMVSFDELSRETDYSLFNSKEVPLAVFLSGEFPSLYRNRVKPEKLSAVYDKGKGGRMLVCSDGDIIANQVHSSTGPMPLGYDYWTGSHYGNLQFLQNSVAYLTGKEQLLEIRNRQIITRLLDGQKLNGKALWWSIFNAIAPLLLIAAAWLGFKLCKIHEPLNRKI